MTPTQALRSVARDHAKALVEEAEAFVRLRARVSSDGQAERMAQIETAARTVITAAELLIAEQRLGQSIVVDDPPLLN